MNGDELFKRFHGELVGRPVSFVRLACDMLLLYIDCRPGDDTGLTFWLNPPWQPISTRGVIADSSRIPIVDQEKPTNDDLDDITSAICGKLIDQTITEVRVDPRSFELVVTIGRAYEVKALASDLECDHMWHLRENATGMTLFSSIAGWKVRSGRTTF